MFSFESDKSNTQERPLISPHKQQPEETVENCEDRNELNIKINISMNKAEKNYRQLKQQNQVLGLVKVPVVDMHHSHSHNHNHDHSHGGKCVGHTKNNSTLDANFDTTLITEDNINTIYIEDGIHDGSNDTLPQKNSDYNGGHNFVLLNRKGESSSKKEKAMAVIAIINFVYFVLLVVSSIALRSLALMGEALHNLSDVACVVIAAYTMKLAKHNSYKRAEDVGTLINGISLISMCFYLCIDAMEKLAYPVKIIANSQFILVACFGVIINIVSIVMVLVWGPEYSRCNHSHEGNCHFHNHDTSINNTGKTTQGPMYVCAKMFKFDIESITLAGTRSISLSMWAVLLHSFGDAVISIVVAGLGIFLSVTGDRFPWAIYLDPCVTIFISLLLCYTSVPMVSAACRNLVMP